MLPLHCGRCGRLIGRAEKRVFEGETVCVRCFEKLGGEDVKFTTRQTVMIIGGSLLATTIVLGVLYWVVTRLVDVLT